MTCQRPATARATALYYTQMLEVDGCPTLPVDPVFTRLRITSGVPTLTRELLQSAELTGSAEIEDIRLSNIATNAEIGFELSYGSQDDLFSGLMQSDWVAGFNDTGLTVTVAAAAKTFTVAGVDLTSNVSVGDEVYFAGLTGDNAKPYLVSAISFSTDTTITVIAPDGVLTDEVAATSNIVASDYLLVGNERKYFALLAVYNDLPNGPYYELTEGVEMTSVSMNGAVNAYVTGSFAGVGRKLTGSFALPTGATLEESNTNTAYTGIDTCIYSDGERLALATSSDLSIDRNASPAYVLCDKYMNHVSYDQVPVTLNTGSMFYSPDIDQKFLAETVVSVTMRMSINDQVFSVTIPQGRIIEASKTVDTGDITQAFNVQGFGKGLSVKLRRLDATV